MLRVIIVSLFLIGYYDLQRLGVLNEKTGRGKVEGKQGAWKMKTTSCLN